MANHLIDTVNERFAHLTGENVVIYGMGQLAAELADNRRELVFNIAGVMDRAITEGTFKGIPIVNTENVLFAARVIIIAALGSSCPIIYDRISFLKDKGLDIYFPDGEKRSARLETRASEYFIVTRKRLTELIDTHDVISFDIFDTLLMRKCLFPRDVFDILEDRFGVPGFAAERASAEKNTEAALGRLPSIYEIYEHMDAQEISAEDEIALEKELLIVRGDMAFIFNYASVQKKTIIITSDMYLPDVVMRDILTRLGMTGYTEMYISCEYNSKKADGGIWGHITNNHEGHKILHIGDNALSDHAARSGITSYIVKGTVEVADLLGFGDALSSARGCRDHLTIGTSLGKLLTIDLTHIDDSGKIIIDITADIGYCFIAPQTLGFASWLAQTAAENGETMLLFCARDTYMFMRLYEKICDSYSAPPAKYLYISKRVLCGVLADSFANVKSCIEYYYARFDSMTTVKESVFRLFGVRLPVDEFTIRLVKDVDIEILHSKIKELYFPFFEENARIEKRNFIRYLEKQGVDFRRSAIVDYICGKSIKLAMQLFGGNFYVYGTTDPCSAVFRQSGKLNVWLAKVETPQLPVYCIMKHSQFGEAVYSSAEGTCLAFDEQGNPTLDDEQIDFSVNKSIFKGIEAYAADVDNTVSSETADKVFGALFSGNYSIGSAVKGLTWSSYTANKRGMLL